MMLCEACGKFPASLDTYVPLIDDEPVPLLVEEIGYVVIHTCRRSACWIKAVFYPELINPRVRRP